MNYSARCGQYGLDPKDTEAFPSSPTKNREIRYKMEVIDWCGFMRQTLDKIENSFRGAPVEDSEEHANDMERVRNQVKRARAELDLALKEIYA